MPKDKSYQFHFLFLKKEGIPRTFKYLFHLKSYPFPSGIVNNNSSSFLTITKIVSTFFSLQKLEALDFITMLSQWSSFSSQKVQIRFFAPSLDFPPIFIPAFFYFEESESLTQSCLLLPEGKNVVLMQLSFAYFRDYGGLDTRKC